MTPKVQYCLYNIQSLGGSGGVPQGEEGLMEELDSIIANKATAGTAAAAAGKILWKVPSLA